MPTPRRSAEHHQLNGTYRPDRHGTTPRRVEPMDPTFPDTLPDDHRAAWEELVRGSAPYLAQGDRAAVELTARLLTKSRTGTLTAAEATLLAKMLGTIGATPASRASLLPINSGVPAPNPFEQLDTPTR